MTQGENGRDSTASPRCEGCFWIGVKKGDFWLLLTLIVGLFLADGF
jgi:hypothetical protein